MWEREVLYREKNRKPFHEIGGTHGNHSWF
jgi:hypothetical protein